MGLFDKKYCDICGEKIGLFGNRKLEDGELCQKALAMVQRPPPEHSGRDPGTVGLPGSEP